MNTLVIKTQIKCDLDACTKMDFESMVDLLGVGVRQYADKNLIEKEECAVSVTVEKDAVIIVTECPLAKKQ